MRMQVSINQGFLVIKVTCQLIGTACQEFIGALGNGPDLVKEKNLSGVVVDWGIVHTIEPLFFRHFTPVINHYKRKNIVLGFIHVKPKVIEAFFKRGLDELLVHHKDLETAIQYAKAKLKKFMESDLSNKFFDPDSAPTDGGPNKGPGDKKDGS